MGLIHTVQIFATDIDNHAITTTRAGIYPANIASDISPDRLERLFIAKSGDGAYRIHKGVRDMLIFSEQNSNNNSGQRKNTSKLLLKN